MVEIKYCPSTLAEGYNTYSPQAVKRLFDGKKGNSFLNDKMKRKYLRIVDERVKRFMRKSE